METETEVCEMGVLPSLAVAVQNAGSVASSDAQSHLPAKVELDDPNRQALGDERSSADSYPDSQPSTFATNVANIVGEYHTLDREISGLTGSLLEVSAALENRCNDELIPKLAQMQSLLSLRGDLRRALRSGGLPPELSGQLLAQLDELPGWTEWYEEYRIRAQRSVSLRTVQRALKKLNQKTLLDNMGSEDTQTGNTAEGSSREDDEPQDATDQDETERAEIETGPEILARFAKELLTVLTGASIQNESTRIRKAAAMVRDLQRALDEGKLFEPSPVRLELPAPPPIVGDPVPEPDPDSMEHLRQQLSRMADTNDIAKALKAFTVDLIKPLVEHHALMPTVDIRVTAYREKSRRIKIGDWLEYRGGDDRLTKQVGQEKTLGRVVGEDKRMRPRIRWHDGRQWNKPYSLFLDCSPYSFSTTNAVGVLFDYQAEELYPEAFASYPADEPQGVQPKRKPVKREQSADTPSVCGSDEQGVA